MKKFLSIVSISTIALVNTALAADAPRIGIVNMTQLFNSSAYVQKANQKLQTNVKDMEAKVQAEQKKLQDLVSQYDKIKTPTPAKTSLQTKISAEQTKLNQMTQDYQQKIRDEQNAGMQQFTTLVRAAVEKVAKKQNLNAVLSNAAIVYSDDSWVDVTKDVEAVM